MSALVIRSMIGCRNVFAAVTTGPFGAILAWRLTVGGMLARNFQRLAERKPDLDAGGYACARAGFSEYKGFLSPDHISPGSKKPSDHWR
jgi:arginine:ornithine antiporter / lysine permease